jgi:ATP-dependent DNA helicase RecG
VGVADLDSRALKTFVGRALRWGRIAPDAEGSSDADLLQRLKLTENSFLKRAAVLLFHPDPLHFVSGAFVKIGFFASAADVLYHDVIEGDLFTQADRTLDLLTTKYMKAWISYQGVRRLETLPVPEPALREAVLNAIVHKDYSVAAPIQIKVFDDHLTIWNPGTLPDAWPLERLKVSHPSLPANPDVAAAFFRAGMIEAWGRGIEKMLAACRDAAVAEPTFSTEGSGIWTTFRFAVRTTAAPHQPESGPESGPESRPESRPESGPDSQVKSRPEALRTRILHALSAAPLGKAELVAALGHKTVSGAINRVLRELLATGLIEATIPEKPQSRLQKYRLTTQGKAGLAATRKA